MLYISVLIVHTLVCIFLIIVVLLQSGKAADLAGAFGGMGSQTAFGPRGSATLLSKATTISAVIFMLTSLSLSILATRNAGLGTTVLQDASHSQPAKGTATPPPSAPATPGQTQQAPPMTVTPDGGKPLQIPVPAQSAPAPAQQSQPAPKK
jgi:preprotein translocase subunit SecG